MMHTTVRVILACLAIFVFSGKISFGQEQDYRKNPVWISMIDNPKANYYEALKAYETYWKHHEKPSGEEEELEMGALFNAPEKMSEKEKGKLDEIRKERDRELKREANRKLSESDVRELEEKREMTYQCKRFEQWLREVKPFVQNDGRILSEQEQLDIYNKQVEEQRKQDNKK